MAAMHELSAAELAQVEGGGWNIVTHEPGRYSFQWGIGRGIDNAS
jgi:bacteriocin-like protein